MQPVPSAGKHATGAKRGKTCNRCQARENMQPVPSAGKHVTGAKRGKTCNRCQARENMQPVPSAGKHATGAKRGKTSNRCQALKKATGFGFAPEWLKGLRHEDFAVLGQFCAKIITVGAFRHPQNAALKTMRKISNEFYQGELTIIIILVTSEGMASKLEKIGPIFSSFNPFPSLPSVATDDTKQFEYRRIVFNNKTRPLFCELN